MLDETNKLTKGLIEELKDKLGISKEVNFSFKDGLYELTGKIISYYPNKDLIIIDSAIKEKIEDLVYTNVVLKEFNSGYNEKELKERVKGIFGNNFERGKIKSFYPLFYLARSLIYSHITSELNKSDLLDNKELYIQVILKEKCKINLASLLAVSLMTNKGSIGILREFKKNETKEALYEAKKNYELFKENTLKLLEDYNPNSLTPIQEFFEKAKKVSQNLIKNEKIIYSNLYCIYDEHLRFFKNYHLNFEGLRLYIENIKRNLENIKATILFNEKYH